MATSPKEGTEDTRRNRKELAEKCYRPFCVAGAKQQSSQVGRDVERRHQMRQQSLVAVVFLVDESPVIQQVRRYLKGQPEAISFSQQT